jgi:hemolysin D
MMNRDHLEFLPAALEIQETPPLPASRFILWAIMLFFSISVVWATVGKVDIVGVAQGKIVPSGNVKIIQPLESGVVRVIHVKEGQHVRTGDTLIELDTTLTGADADQIHEQLMVLKLDRARLLTVLNSIDPDVQDDDYFAGINAPDVQINLQLQRIRKQLAQFNANLAALEDERKQRQAERAAVLQRILQLDGTIPLITERAGSIKGLLKDNMVPRTQWLELEAERIEQVREREVQKNTLVSLDAASANIRQRSKYMQSEFESERLSELADVENRIASLEQERIKAEKKVFLQRLTAPVTGRVHQLAIHTIGGVVTPAQELMRIVPEEDAIEVEAWLPNKDIGFVHEGQTAEIKVETFPFTKYGTIDGEIKTLSNDATADENLGLVYAMRVKMAKTTMPVNEKMVNLSPGMAVTVEMNMGKRKLIEYLLSPLLRYKDESVRER